MVIIVLIKRLLNMCSIENSISNFSAAGGGEDINFTK